jgi:hypothetical protein
MIMLICGPHTNHSKRWPLFSTFHVIVAHLAVLCNAEVVEFESGSDGLSSSGRWKAERFQLSVHS